MKKKRFLFNAAVLTGTSLVTRTIGISFRVYMSNIIGAEGIGLYHLRRLFFCHNVCNKRHNAHCNAACHRLPCKG